MSPLADRAREWWHDSRVWLLLVSMILIFAIDVSDRSVIVLPFPLRPGTSSRSHLDPKDYRRPCRAGRRDGRRFRPGEQLLRRFERVALGHRAGRRRLGGGGAGRLPRPGGRASRHG